MEPDGIDRRTDQVHNMQHPPDALDEVIIRSFKRIATLLLAEAATHVPDIDFDSTIRGCKACDWKPENFKRYGMFTELEEKENQWGAHIVALKDKLVKP
jgi:hypothetical protein